MTCIWHAVNTSTIHDTHTLAVKNIEYFTAHKKSAIKNIALFTTHKKSAVRKYTFHDAHMLTVKNILFFMKRNLCRK